MDRRPEPSERMLALVLLLCAAEIAIVVGILAACGVV